MELKRTYLLNDEPADSDEFGPHKRISELIRQEIITSATGRTIAVIGEWGSGKSTVVRLLLSDLVLRNPSDVHFFVYDAWSHQGDSLRRAFLDDLVASLTSVGLLTTKESEDATAQVWNRVETTETTKEPMLRAHAKWFLVALGLAALGFKFLGIPADLNAGIWDALTTRNVLALLLILAPVLLAFVFAGINRYGKESTRQYFFGPITKNFSVLSFFFEKVQGQVERKNIKSPVDSITEFKGVFHELLLKAHQRQSKRKIVIIIDNIDRIQPDKAREFWSTIQTFFETAGGTKQALATNYWLIAPFSIGALSFIFRGGAPGSSQLMNEDDVSHARAYVSKTFSVVFHVPPPILTNWRRYLLKILKEAFPDHDEGDLVAVREVFDSVRSSDQSTITPREMKLFVNDLVVLYRQRSDQISLPVTAAYVLRKSSIKKAEIDGGLLTSREKRIIDEPDWRAKIAALHFGVGLDEAIQILLQEPIRGALIEGSPERLQQQADLYGFFDVLPKVLAEELEKTENIDSGRVARIAFAISKLHNADSLRLQNVWRSLGAHLRSVQKWGSFDRSTADGLRAVLERTTPIQRGALCQSLSKSLSNAAIPDPDDTLLPVPYERATTWLLSAIAILRASEYPSTLKLTAPGSSKLQLEMLQQLANSNIDDAIRSAIGFSVVGQLDSELVQHLDAGRHLREPCSFIKYYIRIATTPPNWSRIIQSAENRLRLASINAIECNASISLMLAIGRFADQQSATASLGNLSREGLLPHFLITHHDVAETKAAIVLATLLSNPSYDRPQHVERSAKADKHFQNLIASPVDEVTADAIIKLVSMLDMASQLFEIAAKNQRIASFVASILNVMLTLEGPLNIDPNTVLANAEFLEQQSSALDPNKFIRKLKDREYLLSLLTDEPFDLRKNHIYLSAIESAVDSRNEGFLPFLKRGILSLGQADWDIALATTTSGPHRYLMELCLRLRAIDGDFVLSVNTRDAVREMIRKVARAEISPEDSVRERIEQVVGLIQQGQQSSLIRDVLEDMIGACDDSVPRTIDFFGDQLNLGGLLNPEQVVRRIFTPIINSPTEISVGWVADMIDSRREFFQLVPSEDMKVFSSRLESALHSRDKLSPAALASLTKIADLLRITLVAS